MRHLWLPLTSILLFNCGTEKGSHAVSDASEVVMLPEQKDNADEEKKTDSYSNKIDPKKASSSALPPRASSTNGSTRSTTNATSSGNSSNNSNNSAPESSVTTCTVGTTLVNNSCQVTYPVFSHYSPKQLNHFYDLPHTSITIPASYYLEGAAWAGLTRPVPASKPVYRFYSVHASSGRHYYTINESEKSRIIASGWTFEGVSHYAFASQVQGTVPVHRFYHSAAAKHYFSLSADIPKGFTYHGIAFYVPSVASKTTPLMEGFLLQGGSTVIWSNGAGLICSLNSMNQFRVMTGLNDTSSLPQISVVPAGHQNLGTCTGTVSILPGQLSLAEGQKKVIGSASDYLILQNDGNLVLYSKGKALWSTGTQKACSGKCGAVYQSDGNLVLYHNGTPYWDSTTSGLGKELIITLGTSTPLRIYSGNTKVWDALSDSYDFAGWYGESVSGSHISLTPDSTIRGWVADRKNPTRSFHVQFYLDGPVGTGRFMGQVYANGVSYLTTSQMESIKLPHLGRWNYAFTVPHAFLSASTHSLYVYAVTETGTLKQIAQPAPYISLPSRGAFSYTPREGRTCIDGNCPSIGDFYSFGAHYGNPAGMHDGVNYFKKWGCKSSTGVNTIRKLNIAPAGAHHPMWAKDSLFINFSEFIENSPVLHFTSARLSMGSKWALKKTYYSASQQRWVILDVLDQPNSAGGLSSFDGDINNFVMNDYNEVAWGPTASRAGNDRANKIPGVSNTSLSTTIGSYSMLGTGPLGITQVQSLVQNQGITGATSHCVHMNPTLLGRTADGRPTMLGVYLFSNADGKDSMSGGCVLPNKQSIPAGFYIYYFSGAAGWQLNPTAITDLRDGQSDTLAAANKMFGSETAITWATWSGRVSYADVQSAHLVKDIVDCRNSGMRFGEGTGAPWEAYFLGTSDANFNSVDKDSGYAWEQEIYKASYEEGQ